MKKTKQQNLTGNGGSIIGKAAVGTLAASMLLSANVMANADGAVQCVLQEGLNQITVNGSTEYCQVSVDQAKELYVYSSSNNDTYGYLYDDEMNELTSNDDGGPDSNFLIHYSLEAGKTYYVGVKYYSSGDSGTIPVNLLLLQEGDSGLMQSGTNYYYVEEGVLIMDDWREVDGNRYYFMDECGEMARNTTKEFYDDDLERYCYYRFGNDGKCVTGWYTVTEGDDNNSAGRYYYDEIGRSAQGFLTIGGKLYAFDNYGKMYTQGTAEIYDEELEESYWYRFDQNGAIVTGWYQENGYDYYYDEKGRGASGFTTISGNLYYFYYNGRMAKDTTEDIYDQETGSYYYCRFDNDGQLVTGWYVDDYGRYYYDEQGHALSGLQQVGDDTYYFEYGGQACCSQTKTIDNMLYYFDETGKMTDSAEMTEGWMQFNGATYYVQDGVFVKNQWITIDESLYYFDYDGVMYKNRFGSRYESDQGRTVYYRFGENGQTVKGWFTDENGDRYCYDENGRNYQDFAEVDGKQYYFNSNGKMYKDTTTSRYDSQDQKYYYYRFDAEGQMVTGWYETQYGDRYYYDENGRAVSGFRQIDGKTYYFTSEGQMRKNTTTSIYNQTTGTYDYYRFDANGQVVTGWFNEYGTAYYYTENGAAAKGLFQIDTDTYYFSDYGEMQKNKTVTIDGTMYFFGGDGKLTDQLELTEDGPVIFQGESYYLENGEFVKNQWKEVDGKRYYYDSYGKMAKSTVMNISNSYYRFDENGDVITGWYTDPSTNERYYYLEDGKSAYDIVAIGGKRYYFNYQGKIMTNTTFSKSVNNQRVNYRTNENGEIVTGWYQENNGIGQTYWYYYKEDGVGAMGLTEIGGKTYYFSGTSSMYVSSVIVENRKMYYFDASGKLTASADLKDGWNKFNNAWYYVENGDIVKNEFRTVEGKTYYFGGDGVMLTNTTRRLYDQSTGNYYNYRFDGDGLIVTGWYTDGDDRYFYDENGHAVEEFVEMDGHHYYFSADGKLLADLDENVMTTATTSFTIGKDGSYYKFQPDKSGVLFLYSLSGKDTQAGIYDSEMGYIASNDDGGRENNFLLVVDVEEGETYYIWADFYDGGNGEVMPVVVRLVSEDGPVEIDSSSYYVEEGSLYHGWRESGGKYSYYDYDGRKLYGTTSYLEDPDGRDKHLYRFDDNGNMVTGWFKDQYGDWYYYDANGHALEGLTAVRGKNYYFDEEGRMMTNVVLEIENKLYYFDASGVQKDSKAVQNGWFKFHNNWYYGENDVLVKGLMKTIGNKTYYLDDAGRMLTDDVVRLYDSTTGNYSYYRFDANGYRVTGWYQDADGDWFYYGTDGRGADGALTLSNKEYMFDDGKMCTETTVIENRCFKYYGSNGELSVTQEFKNGWNQFRGHYYYVENGELIKNAFKTIGGKTYIFNFDGELLVNMTTSRYRDGKYGTYRVNANGELVTGWYEAGDNDYYYYDETGRAASGILTLDGKTYYFQSNGHMNKDAMTSDSNKLYYFGSDGVLEETLALENGWLEFRGEKYYVANNALVKSKMYQIDGKTYYFSYDGKMGKNLTYSWWEGKKYYCYRFDGEGNMVTGWYVDYDSVYYYDETGCAAYGMTELDGEVYYFGDYGRMAKNTVISDAVKIYYFGSDGALVDSKDLTNGWIKFHGNYYYVSKGTLLRETMATLGGKTYYFDDDAIMVTDTVIEQYSEEENREIYYRFGSSGTVVTGWYQEEDYSGRTIWYHYDSAGRSDYGVKVLSGKTYNFDEEGIMLTDTLGEYNGKVYYFGSDGIAAESVDIVDGWFKFKEKWYYGENATLARGVKKISGKTYYFDYDTGIMTACLDDHVITPGDYDAEINGDDVKIVYFKYVPTKDVTGIVFSDGDSDTFGYLYDENMKQLVSDDDGGRSSNFSYSYNFKKGKTYYIAVKFYNKERKETIPFTLATLTKAGWNGVNNEWYYLQDGKVVTGWKLISNKYYYFGTGGMMKTDTTVWAADPVTGSGSYQFRMDGSGNMVTGWFTDNYGSTYYYDENGHAVKGVQEIDGKTYYFTSGGLEKNAVSADDKKIYVTNNNGVITETKDIKNGWISAGGKYFYGKNGKLVKSGVVKSGSSYYLFDSEGKMATNIRYGINGVYYRANEDGTLCVNEWYHDGDGNSFYYGNEGVGAKGAVTIGGKLYIFENNARVYKNTIFSYDGKIYVADSEGVAKQVGNGWAEVMMKDGSSRWAFVRNGQIVRNSVETISGAKYYFNGAYMMTDGLYFTGDSGQSKYYIIGSTGKIVANKGWYKYNGKWYYITEDASLFVGTMTDGGVKYQFAPSMIANKQAVVGKDFIAYKAAGGGALTEITVNGFYSTEAYGGLIYVENGKAVHGTMKTIGGATYYFDDDCMLTYGRNEIDNDWYYFGGDGKMAVSGWFRIGNSMVYAGEDGKLYTGNQTIDGTDYRFGEEGNLVNGLVYYKGSYTVYKDGVLAGEISKNGWNLVGGSYYYMKNGSVLNGPQTIGGSMYIFSSSIMQKNSLVWYNGYRYMTGSDGKVMTGWIKYGDAYYYADPATGALMVDCSATLGGKEYFFNSDGVMITYDRVEDGKVYIYGSDGALTGSKAIGNGWTYVGGNAYYYKDGKPFTGWTGEYYVRNGVMVRNGVYKDQSTNIFYLFDEKGKLAKNQWVGGVADGVFEYAKADGSLAKNEWLTIDGVKYYFQGTAKAVGLTTIDGETYLFDRNGALIEKVASGLGTGWKKKGNDYYYAYNGSYVRDEALFLSNKWYYFNYYGVMVKNAVVNDFYYGSDGSRQMIQGWKKIDGKFYYFDANSTVVNGWNRIDGNWYYFDYNGVMVTVYKCISQKLYQFSSNGSFVKECVQENGWFKGGDDYYYYENGMPVAGTVRTINKKQYYFDYQGKMVTNNTFYYNGIYHYADANGVVVTAEGWYTTGEGKKIYVLKGGEVCDGVYKINGTLYYFTIMDEVAGMGMGEVIGMG